MGGAGSLSERNSAGNVRCRDIENDAGRKKNIVEHDSFGAAACPPPKKQSFSTNNYYHPDFDDNEEDDFVLDGIGGLDSKHDV